MSSVDLHHHLQIQKDIPEAFALVLNYGDPSRPDGPTYGMYQVSELGCTELGMCKQEDFHLHDDSDSLYQPAYHVRMDETMGIACKISSRFKSMKSHPSLKMFRWTPRNYGLDPAIPDGAVRQPVIEFSSLPGVVYPEGVSDRLFYHLEHGALCLTDNVIARTVPPASSPSQSPRSPSPPPEPCPAFQPPPPTSRPELTNAYGPTLLVPDGGFQNRPSTSQLELFHDYGQSSAAEIGTLDRALNIFKSCGPYIRVEAECVAAIVEEDSVMKSLCQLESSLATLCYTGLAAGMLYSVTFVINKRYTYTRFMNYGVLHGADSLLPEPPSSPDGSIHWRVMTKSDFAKKKEAYFNKLKENRDQMKASSCLSDTGRRWKDVVHRGQKSVINAYTTLLKSAKKKGIELVGTCIQVLKAEKSTQVLDHKYADLHYQTGIYPLDVIRQCQDYRLHGNFCEELPFSELLDSNITSDVDLKVQASFINAIPNDPAAEGGKMPMYSQHFSCGSEPSYKPTSTRNFLLYLHHRDLQKFRKHLGTYLGLVKTVAPKRQQIHQSSSRTKRVRLDNNDHGDHSEFPISACESSIPLPPRTPYDEFALAMVEKGSLHWRTHTADVDILVMNDVDLTSGIFQLNKFCHLTRIKEGGGGVFYSCDCQMFSMKARHSSDSEEIQCIHVRFFTDFILEYHATPDDLPSSPIGKKIQAALESKNVGVVRVDHAERYHSFSVMANDTEDCVIVTLEKNRFRCHKGLCRSRKGYTRKTSQLNDKKANLCQHLVTIRSQQELWHSLVDPPLPSDDPDPDDPDDVDGGGLDDGVEVDDVDPPSELRNCDEEQGKDGVIYFDESTGLWKSKSVSTHVPRSLDDPVLLNAIQQRLSLNVFHPDYDVDEEGFYMRKTEDGLQPLEVYPVLDKDLLCNCGKKYWTDDNPNGFLGQLWKKPVTVYLLHGAAKYLVYYRDCVNKEKGCRLEYSGREHGLHILSPHTAAGDELGWDFIEMVMNSQSSLSCFCKMKACSYYGSKVSFMSRQTFVNWIFSWLVNFKTDFRTRCSVCGDHPSALAADGTKLGIYFRHSSINPIEMADCDLKFTPSHRRNDRQFFSYSIKESSANKKKQSCARQCLGFFVAKKVGKLEEFKKSPDYKAISGLSDDQKKEAIISSVPTHLQAIFIKYIDVEFDQSFIQALNPIFHVFSSEVPLTSLINPRFTPLLLDIVADVGASLLPIRDDLPEIYRMFYVCGSLADNSSEYRNYAAKLIEYCIAQIQSIRSRDREPEAVGATVKPYNPEKQGIAYYFTENGGQIRHMPTYDIKDDKNPNASCAKHYVEAAKSGTTYLFLVFDPAHYGHCYGFHVITTSEGRKDAFAPPYLYMEKAPKEFYYDFSCQLEEYCLNREPKYWQNTRFWHDIFHGYTHKCPFVYTSRRVKYLQKHNTEICEQFNSYIQKIKYSGRAMSQTHFIFYLQFFIDRWNRKKCAEYEKQIETIRNLSL